MSKYNLGNSLVKLNKNIKKGKVYVDNKGDKVIDEMTEQLYKIEENLNKIFNTMNKLVYKKVVQNQLQEEYINWSKICLSQATTAHLLAESLKYNYKDDCKTYAISKLDNRIYELEKKIAKLMER